MNIRTMLMVGFCLLVVACDKQEEVAKPEVKQEPVQQVESVKADDKKEAKVAEIHPGQTLHQENCIACHDSSVYTREDRRVGSFPKLLSQVRLCDANLGTSLFDEDIDHIADYLNKEFYKFK